MNYRKALAAALAASALVLSTCGGGNFAPAGRPSPATTAPTTAGPAKTLRAGALTVEFDTPLPSDAAQAAVMKAFRKVQVLWNRSQSAQRVLASTTGYVTGQALIHLGESIRLIKSRHVVPAGIDRMFKTTIAITGSKAVVSTCGDVSRFRFKNVLDGEFDKELMPTAKTAYLLEQWLMTASSGHWELARITAAPLPKAGAKHRQP